jgi:hypothetical protein
MIREKLIEFVPPRFYAKNIFRWLYCHALIADAALELILQAAIVRFPGIGTETALSRMARDRGIRQGFAETSESFAERLLDWLDAHKRAGSAFEVMRQVQGYLGPKKPRIRHVITKGPPYPVSVWRTLNTDGTTETAIKAVNFDWDGLDTDNTYTSRAWLIIYSVSPENPWDTDGDWDSTAASTWDEDELIGTWGSTATQAQIQGVRDIIRDWKGAQSLYQEVIISFDATNFDPEDAAPPNPDGTWAHYGTNDAGTEVPARDLNSVFWLGTG